MRKIKNIVIHCSATTDGREVSREQIERDHKARGFAKIGYHYLIQPRGLILVGRNEDEIGAHVAGHNSYSLGVCMIGTKKFTVAAWESLRALVHQLTYKYENAVVVGHRDLSPDLDNDGIVEPNEWVKICPGFDVKEWYERAMRPLEEHVCTSNASR